MPFYGTLIFVLHSEFRCNGRVALISRLSLLQAAVFRPFRCEVFLEPEIHFSHSLTRLCIDGRGANEYQVTSSCYQITSSSSILKLDF